MNNETSPSSAASAASSAAPAWLIWVRAAQRLDGVTWLAMLAVLVGWFFLDTLTVTAGPFRQAVRFYDLGALISSPLQLFSGIDAAHRLQVLMFGVVCLLVLCAPLVPHVINLRQAWLACLAPLALMVACGAILYVQTSGDFLSQPADDGGIGSSVVQLANKLLKRGSEPIARHVSIGGGVYLALAGCLFLALRGVRRYREPAPQGLRP
jgi:hypothetical protein